MDRGPASYITVFQQLIHGKKITYTLNAPSLECCLQHILKDYGALKFSVALSSLKEHINYCENRTHSRMEKLRAVYYGTNSLMLLVQDVLLFSLLNLLK